MDARVRGQTSEALALAVEPEAEAPGRSAVRGVLGSPEGAIGAALLLLILAVIVIGPHVAPYSATETAVGPPSAGPSGSHWFGTDSLGRDVLSRVLAGGGSVVQIPAAAIGIAFLVGAVIGMGAGYAGGWIDGVATRVLDVLLSIPPLLTVLVILAAFGTGTSVLLISVALVYMPKIARVLRGAAQAVRVRDYVLAAQARGEASWWIVAREIGPNMLPTLFVELALRITFAIIFVATLNFLGLGVQPPNPNWGLMVSESRNIIVQAPLAALAPAAAIALLAISINLIADALTKHFGDETVREGVIL